MFPIQSQCTTRCKSRSLSSLTLSLLIFHEPIVPSMFPEPLSSFRKPMVLCLSLFLVQIQCSDEQSKIDMVPLVMAAPPWFLCFLSHAPSVIHAIMLSDLPFSNTTFVATLQQSVLRRTCKNLDDVALSFVHSPFLPVSRSYIWQI